MAEALNTLLVHLDLAVGNLDLAAAETIDAVPPDVAVSLTADLQQALALIDGATEVLDALAPALRAQRHQAVKDAPIVPRGNERPGIVEKFEAYHGYDD